MNYKYPSLSDQPEIGRDGVPDPPGSSSLCGMCNRTEVVVLWYPSISNEASPFSLVWLGPTRSTRTRTANFDPTHRGPSLFMDKTMRDFVGMVPSWRRSEKVALAFSAYHPAGGNPSRGAALHEHRP